MYATKRPEEQILIEIKKAYDDEDFDEFDDLCNNVFGAMPEIWWTLKMARS